MQKEYKSRREATQRILMFVEEGSKQKAIQNEQEDSSREFGGFLTQAY